MGEKKSWIQLFLIINTMVKEIYTLLSLSTSLTRGPTIRLLISKDIFRPSSVDFVGSP